ncbi:MAG: serine/threonine-protein kinase PknD [Parachlamydia sp.]|jgi:serine/threonine-protein kinase|nr:serine/threonine-protein kinase PknD [Parachlamydia sp.]
MPHLFSCIYCQKDCQLESPAFFLFCPYCGKEQQFSKEKGKSDDQNQDYQIIKTIGKGGMGEVFLAYDPLCSRQIAIKKIRSDLLGHPHIRHRFLKEAYMTCQLTHPAIMPIYTIQEKNDSAYYTMPFVEGETLKQIIRKTRIQEKKGEKLNHLGASIHALMRIFMTICQGVAYAHSKNVLHRDIKPENIIVGKYGEVLILDWGLAKFIDGRESEDEFNDPSIQHKAKNITRLGKVVGTISYMAPERALGMPATVQTDIYALGVILYQLLTLQVPFKRESLDSYKKNMHLEEWRDPVIAAPYRDVPRLLAQYTQKCMATTPQGRYQTVNELIMDIEGYLEGRSEWFPAGELTIEKKEDWEFQENVLMAGHMAVSSLSEEADWVSLMVSKLSLSGNTKIEAEVALGEKGNGIGFLLSIPEAGERTHIDEGYCLWLGSDDNRSTKLFKSHVEVLQAPDIFLKRQEWYRVRIEKIDKSIHVYLNDLLQFSYIAHIPLIGTHIGVLSRDADFMLKPIQIYVGSLNLTVNCLAIPDAFLANQNFAQALSEYRRIAYSFPDRVEGREALFRAGLTLLEQAEKGEERAALVEEAFNEFQQLHGTPGAPLEYLGKALTYQFLHETEEEIKCFELAYRRYPRHPLLPMLHEQMISRLHEVSRRTRSASYQFSLLTVRHLPPSVIDAHTKRLFFSLQKHWEPLPFIKNKLNGSIEIDFAIPLAFWLGKPYVLEEIIDELFRKQSFFSDEMNNALFSLAALGSADFANEKLKTMQASSAISSNSHFTWLDAIAACSNHSILAVLDGFFPTLLERLNFYQQQALLYLLDQAIDRREHRTVSYFLKKIGHKNPSAEFKLQIHIRRIWDCLLQNKWEKAGELLHKFPVEILHTDSTIIHFLYGCYLRATEEKNIADIQFNGLLPVNTPRSWTLASHELIGTLPPSWHSKAFLWEKRQLYRQLVLYYHCAGKIGPMQENEELYHQQFIHIET